MGDSTRSSTWRSGTAAAASIATRRVQVRAGQDRQEAAGHDQRAAHADRLDEEWSSERADRERHEQHAVDRAEDSCEEIGRRGALQQRVAGDSDDRPACADEREQDERDRLLGPDTDEDERQAPEGDADTEARREAAARRDAADDEHRSEAADTRCRVEKPKPGRAGIEGLQREHDDEHVERTVDDGLRCDEPDDETKPRHARESAEAREGRPRGRRHPRRLRSARAARGSGGSRRARPSRGRAPPRSRRRSRRRRRRRGAHPGPARRTSRCCRRPRSSRSQP